MKIISTLCLLLFISIAAFSQTIEVSGTVNSQNGQPVPFAFVRDVQHNYATFADSTGTFLITADPASSLEVSANGYQNAGVKIDNKTSLSVVLPTGAAAGAVVSANDNAGVTGSFLRRGQLLVVQSNKTIGGTAAVKEGFVQEPTRGSRYLFANWIPGFGINKKDSLVVEKENYYNYDKIGGNIIYTNDGKSMAQVSTSQVKSFSLFDKKGKAHVYENAPAVSEKPFVEVLVSTPKYKIYKKMDTKLSRADFHTDGVLEMGHRYDEYVDVNRYYLVTLPDGKPQSISLKKSALKKIFGADAEKFMSAQGSRDVDEDYVRELGYSLAK